MKNWSGSIKWNPSMVAAPSSEQEIQDIIVNALNDRHNVRVIGTGHSFTALCTTNEVLMHLDNYQGLVSVDSQKCQATVKGGTKLRLLGELLYEQGMAMENLGDIDVQSIAGTISTGTHGTGIDFGTMSTQVVKIKMVNGKGAIVECSQDHHPDLFKAAQVSLGVLGVIIEVTLQCVPTYRLRLVNKTMPMAEVLGDLDMLNQQNRNFEFYWFPYSDNLWTKSSNAVLDPPEKSSALAYLSDYILENYGYKLLCEIAYRFPSTTEAISKFTSANSPNIEKCYDSHKVYATQRLVKFNEMEYNIPREHYHSAFKDVVKLLNSKKYKINFPIESRFVRKDDIYMSPAYGRDSAYIACHAYSKKDPKPYFAALEEIFRSYGGRPHWGKMNTLTPTDIAELYPQFGEFMRHRKEQDPEGIFLNAYLGKLLGL